MEFHHFDEETGYFSDVWMPHLIASMGSTNAYGVVDFYTGIQNLRKSAEVRLDFSISLVFLVCSSVG